MCKGSASQNFKDFWPSLTCRGWGQDCWPNNKDSIQNLIILGPRLPKGEIAAPENKADNKNLTILGGLNRQRVKSL